jgi:hypothetical protein
MQDSEDNTSRWALAHGSDDFRRNRTLTRAG